MSGPAVFAAWAPEGGRWSPWAKPVLFVRMASWPPELVPERPEWAETSWAPDPRRGTAIVADLAGPDSVKVGLALARLGWRPVPCFDGAPGPAGMEAAVDVQPVVGALSDGTSVIRRARIEPDAAPVFLLDCTRLRRPGMRPGTFDNRWAVFPQDFPSAAFLRQAGIERVLLLRERGDAVGEDLAHVLLRWKEGGLELAGADPRAADPPAPLEVPRPSRFRSMVHRALVLVGLRRNSAGGFGAEVPVPSEGGSG